MTGPAFTRAASPRPVWAIVTIAGALVISACNSTEPITAADTSTSTSGITTSVAAPPQITTGWERLALEPGSGQMRAITATGSGFVAVGRVDGGGGDLARVWMSADGAMWTVVDAEGDLLSGSMVAVAAGVSGIVAVGHIRERAAVWISANGLDWQLISADEEAFAPLTFIDHEGGQVSAHAQAATAVIDSDRGMLVFGFDEIGYSMNQVDQLNYPAGIRPTVWAAEDGSWRRSSVGDQAPGVRYRTMNGAVATEDGVVVVGSDRPDGDAGSPLAAAVWRLVDGDWEPMQLIEGPEGSSRRMEAIAAGDPGLVAIGFDERNRSPVVWFSEDAVTWSIVGEQASLMSDGILIMWDVAWTGTDFVIVGTESAGGAVRAAIWSSQDGLTWDRVPDPADLFGGDGVVAAYGIAVSESGNVIVVGSAVTDVTTPVVWVRSGS